MYIHIHTERRLVRRPPGIPRWPGNSGGRVNPIYVCVCVYEYMYICIYVYIYVHSYHNNVYMMYACIYIYTYIMLI